MQTLRSDECCALKERFTDCFILQAYASGRKVFYDVLGLFFVSYSVPFGHILNVTVALLSIFVPYFLLNKTTKSIHSKRIRKEMLIGLMVNVLAAVLAFGLCYAIGLELDFTGNSLVWYHHTVFAVVFYCLPTVLVFCWLHRILNDSRYTPLSLGLKVQARLNGSNIMWGALVIYITALGYRSAYLFMVPLAFTLLANIVIGITGVQNSSMSLRTHRYHVNILFSNFSQKMAVRAHCWTGFRHTLDHSLLPPGAGNIYSSSRSLRGCQES